MFCWCLFSYIANKRYENAVKASQNVVSEERYTELLQKYKQEQSMSMCRYNFLAFILVAIAYVILSIVFLCTSGYSEIGWACFVWSLLMLLLAYFAIKDRINNLPSPLTTLNHEIIENELVTIKTLHAQESSGELL